MITIVSHDGELLPLAMRLEGSQLAISSSLHKPRGEGLVEKPSTSSSSLLSGTHLLLPGFHAGSIAEAAKKRGIRVWGGGRWSDAVNNLPFYSAKMMDLYDIKQPPQKLQYIYDGKAKYFIQLEERYGLLDCGGGPQILSVLQARVYTSDTAKNYVPYQLLSKANYQGPIQLGVSLKARLSIPHFAVLSELTLGPLQDIIEGKPVELREDRVAVAVRVSLPPFPYADRSHLETFSWTPPDPMLDHLWLIDYSEGTAGIIDGNLGWVSAWGEDLREATRRIYRTIDNIPIPSLQYISEI